MAWLVDDVAEAALGPWGLLVGVGVGVGILARKRLAPIASTAVAGALETTDRAREEVGRRAGADRPGRGRRLVERPVRRGPRRVGGRPDRRRSRGYEAARESVQEG